MTGLSLAYNLQEHNVTIFDKSWRPGGRVSTRKHDNYLFDHGAHYLSTNHSVNQLNEVITKYNLGQIIEINFATDFLKIKNEGASAEIIAHFGTLFSILLFYKASFFSSKNEMIFLTQKL